ncbi:hypothetical protein AMTR_s00047p00203430 [Amborella trichopoda]|uniref:Uncharacterized protein n=1 Tax=Amborella trichopoda TaxID=13333 RepID=U5CWY9_AMBTC|nr:hypothetical protein AMTR_s00047p00203430 [Amborella trichopoda]
MEPNLLEGSCDNFIMFALPMEAVTGEYGRPGAAVKRSDCEREPQCHRDDAKESRDNGKYV